jgi:type I restriction enzyme, S subunit
MSNIVKLKDVCEFKRGLTYAKSDEVDYSNNVIVRATNIDRENNKLNLAQLKYIKESIKINEDKILKKGDILICTASGSMSHLGKVALIDDDIKMAFGGFMGVLRTSVKCLPKFLYNILVSQKFKKVLLSNTSGVNINNLKFSQIENFEFILPPLHEQQHIIAKLDVVFAEINKVEDIEFKKKESTKILVEIIVNNIFDKLKNISKSVKLSSVIKFENGDRGKNYPSKKYQLSVGIPFINAGDLSLDGEITTKGMVYISEDRFNILGAGKIKLNDILFCLRGSLGKCALNKTHKRGAIASSLVIMRVDEKKILPKFLLAYLQSGIIKEYIKNTSSGTAQPNLSANTVSNYEIPLPSIEEQELVSSKIENIKKEYFILREINLKKKNNLETLKSSVLFGKIKYGVA